MEIVGVQVEVPANTPVLMLRERAEPGRVLPIYIGGAEASSIHQALNGDEPPRPLTHDLMCIVLESVGSELRSVTVTDLRSGTFYAELELVTGSETARVSARPSDAVALAVRVGAPVFAAEQVLDEAGQIPSAVESDDTSDELVDEFRRFIDEVNPEDFES